MKKLKDDLITFGNLLTRLLGMFQNFKLQLNVHEDLKGIDAIVYLTHADLDLKYSHNFSGNEPTKAAAVLYAKAVACEIINQLSELESV